MAAAASVNTDLTTCPICLDLFDNPMSLPCLHAFCLKCLQSYFNEKTPGDEVPCPTCRKWFRIPSNGLEDLQHHFIVQKLVDQERELIQLRESSCDRHKDEQLKLYCHDCNENVCLMCYAVKHRNHNSAEIPEVADDFVLRMNDDDQQIQSALNAVREQSAETKQHETEFLSSVEDVKQTVLATGDVIKRLVDRQINDVLMELQSVMSESAKQAESVQEAYQLALVSLESFHTYSRELLDKGRLSDITRAASELHNRAKELLDNGVTAVKYRPPHLTFTPADVTQVERLSLIGKLTIRTEEGLCQVCFVHFRKCYSKRFFA